MTSRPLDHSNLQRLIIAALGTLFFAVLLTSCGTRHAQCSAYGDTEWVDPQSAD